MFVSEWISKMELQHLALSDSTKSEELKKVLSGLILDRPTLERVREVFRKEIELGLKYGLEKSSVQMETTYVTQLLRGTESGKFLALDLGSTNFRVLLISLSGGRILSEEVRHFSVATETRLGPGRELFSFLADCIKTFLTDLGLLEESLSLGFTFSFPMAQEGLRAARLVSWTKSFNCPGVEGEEVVGLLQTAVDEAGLKVKVVAILNDTTGTLVAGSYQDHDCTVGLIMGSGHNGCYFESTANLVRWDASQKDDWVIVDPEFGAFGDPGEGGCLDFIRTEFDNAVDRASLLPGKYTFEKYIGGNFLGEIARYILEKLSSSGILELTDPKNLIRRENSFPSKYITEVERDGRMPLSSWRSSSSLAAVTSWLGEQEGTEARLVESLAILQSVCGAVSER